MSFDAYKIAVKLSLVNNVSSGLVGLATQFQSLNNHINSTHGLMTQLERKMLDIKRMGLIGGAMAGAGAFGLSLFAAPLEEAKKFQSEVAKFSALGLGDKATQEAVKFAKGMDIMGMSARDNMSLLREATVITGDMHHAMEAAPFLAKMKSAVTSYMGEEKGAGAERMVMDLLKTAELRGALKDPETFHRTVDFATKAYIASGGLVKPGDLLGAIKTGGVAAKGLSDEAFFFQSLHTMQEMGGQRFGTGLMSAYQNLEQGRASHKAIENLMEMGLLDKSKVEYDTTGKVKGVKQGALKESFLFMSSQFDYFQKDVLPKLVGLSKNDALNKISAMFSQRTAASQFASFYLEGNNIRKTVDMAHKAMGVDALYDSQKGTLNQNEANLQAKWRDVLNELGTTILPLAIRGVEGLTSMLKGVISFAREFPLLTKGVTIAFGSIAALVAAGGTVMLMSSAFSALGLALSVVGGSAGALALGAASPIIAGIAAFGAAVAGIAWIFDHFKPDSKGSSPVPHRGSGAGDHPGRVWIAGHGPRGSGGHYEDQTVAASIPTYVAHPMSGGRNQIHTTINLDGKAIAKVVTDVQARDMRRASMSNGSTYDQTRTVPTAALNHAR